MRSDQEIIAEVLAGKTDSFRYIIERYKRNVATIVRNMIPRADIAEDVGQEVFIRLYKSLAQFKGDAKLSTYIGRIAINLSLNELKKQGKKDFDPISEGLNLADPSQERGVKNREDKEILEYGFARLSPDYRSVLTLRMIEGYSTKETAEILEIPEGTVLSRLSRAQTKLKEILETLDAQIWKKD